MTRYWIHLWRYACNVFKATFCLFHICDFPVVLHKYDFSFRHNFTSHFENNGKLSPPNTFLLSLWHEWWIHIYTLFKILLIKNLNVVGTKNNEQKDRKRGRKRVYLYRNECSPKILVRHRNKDLISCDKWGAKIIVIKFFSLSFFTFEQWLMVSIL